VTDPDVESNIRAESKGSIEIEERIIEGNTLLRFRLTMEATSSCT
jgi:hypothetical protein